MNMHADSQAISDKAFPLALGQNGEVLKLCAFQLGKGLSRRLAGLGLHLGSTVRILHRQGNGSVVVERDNNRVALGAAMTRKILVAHQPA